MPVHSQADVMQTELESCLSLEYTPDSLPPLLHQVRTIQTLLKTKPWLLRCIKPFLFIVLYRPIVSLGSDKIPAHAEMEEILSPQQRH